MNNHCIRCRRPFALKFGAPRYFSLWVERLGRGDFVAQPPFFCSRLCVLAARGERDG